MKTVLIVIVAILVLAAIIFMGIRSRRSSQRIREGKSTGIPTAGAWVVVGVVVVAGVAVLLFVHN